MTAGRAGHRRTPLGSRPRPSGRQQAQFSTRLARLAGSEAGAAARHLRAGCRGPGRHDRPAGNERSADFRVHRRVAVPQAVLVPRASAPCSSPSSRSGRSFGGTVSSASQPTRLVDRPGSPGSEGCAWPSTRRSSPSASSGCRGSRRTTPGRAASASRSALRSRRWSWSSTSSSHGRCGSPGSAPTPSSPCTGCWPGCTTPSRST